MQRKVRQMDVASPPTTDVKALIAAIAPAVPMPVGAALDRILNGMQPAGPLAGRLETLEQLCTWLAEERVVALPADAAVTGQTRAARLWLLVELMRASSAWRMALSRLVCSVIAESSALKLFARTGLPAELRVFSELADRMARKFLPQPPDDADLAALTSRLFADDDALAWLQEAPPRLVLDLVAQLLSCDAGKDARVRILDDVASAISVLSVRIASIGVDEDIRARAGGAHFAAASESAAGLRASPFLELPRVCDAIVQQRVLGDTDPMAARARCVHLIEACRAALARVMTRLEEGSVSVDLVFRLDLLGLLLDRLAALRQLLDNDDEVGPHAVWFLKELVRAGISDRSIGAVVKSNSRLLARKIIERAGETGEHYITSTRAQYHQMITSAAGGGFLTAFTTALKFLVGWLKAPLFFEWLLSGFNYAGSFVLMQGLGFTLATKQPSMTAAALAAALDQRGGLDALVDQIARTARSQLAAVIGNLGMVIPAAVGLHFAVVGLTRAPFLDAETAHYVVHSLNPIASGTLFFAAFTGCVLWASSIIAGWVENWTVYRRLPEAIAKHRRLARLIGAKRCEQLARALSRNISGVGGNVSLGFLLAATPIFGKFFGLPLDVRHVTLSTGALVLAGCSLGPVEVARGGFGWAVVGIACIGLLNFGVSFALALSVALRARNVALADVVGLGRAVLMRFLRRPLSFIVPPREAPTALGTGDSPAH